MGNVFVGNVVDNHSGGVLPGAVLGGEIRAGPVLNGASDASQSNAPGPQQGQEGQDGENDDGQHFTERQLKENPHKSAQHTAAGPGSAGPEQLTHHGKTAGQGLGLATQMGDGGDRHHTQAGGQAAQPHRATVSGQQQNKEISEQNRGQIESHLSHKSAEKALHTGENEALEAQAGEKGQHRQKEAGPCQYLPDWNLRRFPLHGPFRGGVRLFSFFGPGVGCRFLLCHVASLLNRLSIK